MRKIAWIIVCLVSVSAATGEKGTSGREHCKGSIAAYEAKVKATGADASAWREYRACVAELKRWHDGELTASQALKKNPNIAEAHLLIGVARLHTKKFSSAAESLDEAIRIKPDHAQAYYYLGMTYLFQSMPLEASKAGERAVELDPASAANHSQLAYAYYLLDEPEKCEAAAKKATELDANNVAAYKVLGNLYTKQGKSVEADKMFEEAIHANGRLMAASPAATKLVLPGMTTGVAAGLSGTAVKPSVPEENDSAGPEPAQSRDEVETRLIIQWRDMKEAMVSGKLEKGLSYYSDYEGTREEYRKAFAAMGPQKVKRIFSSFSDVEDCEVVLGAATCRASLSSGGTLHVAKVRFEKNPDRVWRIRSY